jgi:hypothetical protein
MAVFVLSSYSCFHRIVRLGLHSEDWMGEVNDNETGFGER